MPAQSRHQLDIGQYNGLVSLNVTLGAKKVGKNMLISTHRLQEEKHPYKTSI